MRAESDSDEPRQPPSSVDLDGDIHGRRSHRNRAYAALDLGTNNCRLLIARPSRRSFQVTDSFSRVIRLGEGVSATGRLAPEAMARTRHALRICAQKIDRARVERARLVATEACRAAVNAADFLADIRDDLGLDIEILTQEEEAKLAVSGCAGLIDPDCDHALVFDIGGGSTEIAWVNLHGFDGARRRMLAERLEVQNRIVAWTSVPVGVVTLAEEFGGRHVAADVFQAMVETARRPMAAFEGRTGFTSVIARESAHLLGTSGTVTTIAGIWLGLQRYDRNRVDGCWMKVADASRITASLLARSYEGRIAEPCIGRDRADLVLAGCAILEAIVRTWPCERLRIADRGLREGILATLMAEDGVHG